MLKLDVLKFYHVSFILMLGLYVCMCSGVRWTSAPFPQKTKEKRKADRRHLIQIHLYYKFSLFSRTNNFLQLSLKDQRTVITQKIFLFYDMSTNIPTGPSQNAVKIVMRNFRFDSSKTDC